MRRPGRLRAGHAVPDDGENIFFLRPESDDTCPQPGKDPVHNFMSYGDDLCLNLFTRGQHHRMLKTWFVFRAFR